MSKKVGWILALLGATLFLVLAFSCSKPEPPPEETVAETAAPALPTVDYNEMVFVPAGKCILGGPADNDVTKFSSPPHEVNLKSFWIDKYEVTFEQFVQFVADTGYDTKGNWRTFFDENKSMLPVFNVTLEDAKAYAKWAKKRLPTQEEWEKAASWDPTKNEQRRWPWGNEWKDGAANAGSRNINDIGLFVQDVSFYGARDMLGNVYEWTDSFYDAYPNCKAKDPNFARKLYVVKGASIYIDGKIWYLSARSPFPSNAILAMGFRCAKDATPEDEAKYSK